MKYCRCILFYKCPSVFIKSSATYIVPTCCQIIKIFAQRHYKPLTNRCASGRTSITWRWVTCVHKARWRTTKHLWYANTNAYMQSHKVQWIHTWIQLSSQELYTLQHMSKESLLVIPLPGVQRLLHSVARAVGDICLLTPWKVPKKIMLCNSCLPPTV